MVPPFNVSTSQADSRIITVIHLALILTSVCFFVNNILTIDLYVTACFISKFVVKMRLVFISCMYCI
jgi:hypothetical protein